MGMLFGGWAREEAEEKLWYIEKYGLGLGTLRYEIAKKEYEERAKYNQEHPDPILYSKTEPKVKKYDVIGEMKGGVVKTARIIDIDGDGNILCRWYTNNFGKPFIWEGEYKKVVPARQNLNTK